MLTARPVPTRLAGTPSFLTTFVPGASPAPFAATASAGAVAAPGPAAAGAEEEGRAGGRVEAEPDRRGLPLLFDPPGNGGLFDVWPARYHV